MPGETPSVPRLGPNGRQLLMSETRVAVQPRVRSGDTVTVSGPLAPSFDEGSLQRPSVAEASDLVITAADGTELVHGVSVVVRPGEALGIVGESGSGKTLTC